MPQQQGRHPAIDASRQPCNFLVRRLLLRQQGRHSIVSSALFLLLVIAISTTMLAYAALGNGPDANAPGCAIACYNDSGCDDKIATTIDVCNSDGTCESYCTNIAVQPECEIACSADSDCDDLDSATLDVCNNEGTCESYCTNALIQPECKIACNNDIDCDDANALSLDLCNNDGTCEAKCVHLPKAESEEIVIIEETGEEAEESVIIESVQETKILPPVSIKDSEGKEIGYKMRLIDENGAVIGSIEQPTAGIEKPEIFGAEITGEEEAFKGIFDVELEIDDNSVKKIVLRKAAIGGDSNLLELRLLQNTKTKSGIEVKKPFLLNPASEFASGELQLSPPSGTNAVLKCKDWNSETSSCTGEWQTVKTFTGNEPLTISISPEDPVFGFAEITIINVQSYPQVGGEWEVRFNTIGKADLAIKAVNGTTWSNSSDSEQLRFLEIRCGSTVIPYEWIDGAVVVRNFECNETGYETSKVLMAGKHALEFTFGEDVKYAYNQAGMLVKYGSFAKPNATTGNQAITGVGFQPKLVIFFGNYKTADGTDVNAQEFFGAATSSTRRAVIASASKDNVIAACKKRWSNALCITQISVSTLGTGAASLVNAEADFVSMNADGFTINWTTCDASQRIINYIALGGDDLTNASVGSFLSPTGVADTAVSVGFTPDALIIFDNTVTTTPTAAGSVNNNAFNIGFVVGTTKQNSRVTMRQSQTTGVSNTYGYQRTNSCQNTLSGTGVAVRTAVIKSMDSNGFTLTFSGTPGTAVYINYIALKGGQYDTGSFNEATSTGNQSVTTGFTPSGVIFQSAGNATSAAVSSVSRISFGVGVSASERGSIWSGDLDNKATSVADSDLNRTRVLRFLVEGPPIFGADMDFVSNDSTGFTVNNTTVDGNAREILYFAFGNAAAATPTPDANVAYPEKGETFSRDVLSTVDVNITVQDNDTNTFTMTVDLNYSTSQTQGTGTVIVDDSNLATWNCDSNNLKTVQYCKYRWTISNVPNGNYYILSEVNDGSNRDFNAGEATFTITTSNQSPDANVVYPENDENFNRDITPTIDVNVYVRDLDNNSFDLNIDLNYSSSQTQGTGTAIINDVNLATLNCDSNDLSTARYCKYNWNISSVQAGNYYILTTVNDRYNIDFNAGEKDFNIWCAGSWPYRMKLYFKNIYQTGDLFDFPVMVKLDPTRIDYSKVGRSNGGDLRFFDSDGSSLYYEIDDWNTAGDSVIWVRVPKVDKSSNTDYIYMDYGNPCTTDGNNNALVWDGNYRAVYHFAELDGNYFDSTANNNDSNVVRITSRNNTDANGLGHYPFFVSITNQDGDHVGVPHNDSLNLELGGFTLSVRANAETGRTLTDSDLVRKGCTGTNNWWKLEWGDEATNNSIHLNIRPDGIDYHLNYTKVPDSLWHDIAGVRDAANTTESLYLDGTRVVGPSAGADGNVSNTWNMGIGSKDTLNDDHFDGYLDEVRIQSIARDGNWLRAERFSFDDNFITYNALPNATIWKVETSDLNAAMPSFTYASDGNLTIKFRATDQDNDDLNFNMWYGISANSKTNKIIGDVNLSTNTSKGACDTNSKSGMVCNWDFNISGVSDNNYWVTVEINDGSDTNTVTTQKSFRVNPPAGPANNVPDVNIWKVDNRDFNAALPKFKYETDGNLTIKFRTSDLDGTQDLNFNMWYGTSANAKTNKIIGDVNLSTNTIKGACDTNSKTTGMVCRWDFNIHRQFVVDNNYWVTIEVNDGTDSNTATTQKSFRVIVNRAPDANIWKVDNWDLNAALPAFSYVKDGNLAIKFRVDDNESNDLNFNMWYGASANAKTTRIINDVNLSTNAGFGSCDTNAKTGMVCQWDWNISGIADNNYWVTIEIKDGVDSNTVTTQKSFAVDNTVPDVNVWNVDGHDVGFAMPSYSYSVDGNLTIDFNVATGDVNYGIHYADINYSTTSTQGSGTAIRTNLDVDGNRCVTNLGKTTSIYGYWKFDAQEDDVNTIRAFDYSGQRNHGQYINGADNNAQGKWDTNAAWFNGVNNFINCGRNSLNFIDTYTYTWMGWFKADDITLNGTILDHACNDTSNTGISIQINSSALKVYDGEYGNFVASSSTLSSNVWYHFAVAYNGSGAYTIYINGKLDTPSSFSWAGGTSTAEPFAIGYNPGACSAANLYFKGLIEEVKVYLASALTASQISLDYNFGVINMRKCSYDWNISGIGDNNYFANILVRDTAGNSKFDASDNSFHVNPTGVMPTTCDCPASGNWNIGDGSACTLSTTCSLNAGDLHISNGQLTITSTGTLAVPSAKKIIIEKINPYTQLNPGGSLILEKGGKVIIHKTGASPFIYILKEGEYFFVSDFIAGAAAKEKEYTSFTNISSTQVSVEGKIKLKITEELDETTYLDRVFLRADGSNDKIIELDSASYADKSILAKSDDKYLVMRQGEEHYLQFDAPLDYSTLEFGAEGYYIVHPEKRKQFFVEKIAMQKQANQAGLAALFAASPKQAGKGSAETQLNLLPFACFIFAYAILLIALRTKKAIGGERNMAEDAIKRILGAISQLKKTVNERVVARSQTKTEASESGEKSGCNSRTNKAMLCISQNLFSFNRTMPLLIALALAMVAFSPLVAAIPELFTVQGRLTDGSGSALSGDYTFNFILYDSNEAAKNILWSETRVVNVSNGIFSVVLGDLNKQRWLSSLDFNANTWLGMYVNGEEQTPLIRFSSIGSAFVSRKTMGIDLNAFMGFNDFNKWYHSIADLNAFYYKAADVNAHFYGKVDLNANFYGKLDVNAHFVPYIGATKDMNLGIYGIKSFSSDSNFNALYARQYFGSGAGLTGIPSQTDINAAFVPYVGADYDVNLNFRDLNARSISAVRFFGSGASLTGIPTQTDINANFYGKLDVNRHFESLIDLNTFYYKKTDVNAGFYGKLDVNAGWYGKLDVNAHFVPYVGGDYDVNLNFRDLNARSISAVAFFGSGASLTGIPTQTDINANFYGKLDVNNQFVPYVGADYDVNLNFRDLNARSVSAENIFLGTLSLGSGSITDSSDLIDLGGTSLSTGTGSFNTSAGAVTTATLSATSDSNLASVTATRYFGSGASLTGIPTQADINANFYGKLDVNRHFESLIDLNTFYYKKTDVNAHFYGKVDLNNNFYGKLDVNNHFVPYIGADYDVNLNFHDLNARSISAVAFFGSGAGLTGIPTQTDVNAAFVPYIGADYDVNLNFRDLNARSVSAVAFFGSGAALTGIPSQSDVNAAFVPYIGADYDVNLGSFALKASDLNAMRINGVRFVSKDANSAYGVNAVALGHGTTAFGDYSAALGWESTASGQGSVAMGYNTIASGNYGVAMGYITTASSAYSIAMGYSTIASGAYSAALGYYSRAAGQGAIAGGYGAGGKGPFAIGDYSIALGYSDVNLAAIGVGSVAIGYNAINETPYSVVLSRDVNVARDLNVMRNASITGTLLGSPSLQIASDVNVSIGVNRGVSIQSDVNRLCFPSNSCEMYIDYNGTAFVFGS